MHVLICLSYLNKNPTIKAYVESKDCKFSDRISKFVEYYTKLQLNKVKNDENQEDDENGDIDKRTILDLCAHMFHPGTDANCPQEEQDTAQQFVMSYEIGEFNDMRTDDRIKEFENEQADLIFECFQDEEHMFGK